MPDRMTEDDGYETIHPILGDSSRYGIVQRLVALEGRVEKIESRTRPAITHDGRIIISPHQLERLERIEQAARVVLARLSQPFQADQPEALRLLEEALHR